MRPSWLASAACLVLAAAVAACSHSPAPRPPVTSTKSPAPHGVAVNPANIRRVVGDLPPGYETTTGIPSGVSPRAIWSLAAGATADPPQCALLADPGDGRDQSAQGVSGSGPGGIVNAVVVAVPGSVVLAPEVVAACGQWSMSSGRDTATVRLVEAPHVDGANTVGMVGEIKSSVESGTEIDSRIYTFVAYLGSYYAFTTLSADPGSALPALPAQFAADLLVKTVSTLRG
ncbi:DUF5642 family protein [Mycobacterium saskatchewanense]|uniref:DUF5642 domain-containing protein n=1 Tax=Mycobacterium saskatchewanense TaxID=220927 RepID=A0AAJ3NP34_9MYCO|nr:DUF5642 family protein [Mycobacterium saskatchewanense]ORW70448.1 hypothetical protein AWC23_17260 [Mycobacterium saskatchewanense]